MGFWIPNGSKINLKQKMTFYPTKKHSCRQEVDNALVDINSTNRQMMGAQEIKEGNHCSCAKYNAEIYVCNLIRKSK